jgi:hypothetical protein
VIFSRSNTLKPPFSPVNRVPSWNGRRVRAEKSAPIRKEKKLRKENLGSAAERKLLRERSFG